MDNNFIINFNSTFKNHNSFLSRDKNDFILETTVENLEKVLFFLRDHEGCLFKMLIDILVVDYPGREKRFSLFYCLLSLKYKLICQKSNINNNKLYNNNRNLYVIYVDIIIFIT